MQDHFLKLGLDPEASRADIEAAIEAKPELSAAAEILLNEHRRAAYQRTVSTLRSIGILRHRLDLDKDDSWFVESCPDFAPRLHSRKFGSQRAASGDTSHALAEAAATGPSSTAGDTPVTSEGTRKPAQSRTWLKPLLVASAIAAILILLIFVL